jgi:threonine synthase
MTSALPGITRSDIDVDERSIWRYRSSFPFETASWTSLGEGCTPLVERPWSGNEVPFKLEWFNPTGSFKDRGASVLVSALAGQGVDSILEDSSGNGGAAIAAYAAAAGLKAKILAPESTSPPKLLQARAFGATVELIPGNRDATAREALRQSETSFYASHNWHPYFLQGTKTLGYEIWEDLGFRAPDNIVLVAGAGSLVLGCDLAFGELIESGEIARRPRLLVAQPANCAPLFSAFHPESGLNGPWTPTIAEGTAIASPVRSVEVVDAVRRSEGDIITLSEEEIGDATRRLAATGLYAEPTSAQAAAAYDRYIRSGALDPNQTTVVVLTGSGLKASVQMTRIFGGLSE